MKTVADSLEIIAAILHQAQQSMPTGLDGCAENPIELAIVMDESTLSAMSDMTAALNNIASAIRELK